MFDPRPLYCSSLTTAVGGTYDINFVDSGSPYCGTNHQAMQLNNQVTHLRNLEMQMGQMANILTKMQQGSLLRNSKKNPRGEGK